LKHTLYLMLFTRIIKSGIDAPIDGLQRLLYPNIVTAWGLNADSAADYNSYSRAYRNQTEEGYVPEVFVGGKEYKEVLVNDKIKALSFFSVGETIQFSGNQLQADVSLLFFVNLTKINASSERADETVRQQIVQMVQGIKAFGFAFTGIETGVDSVLRDYEGLRRNPGVKFRDMHPFHCFKLNFTVRYKSNC
jgi:hypothetical protein